MKSFDNEKITKKLTSAKKTRFNKWQCIDFVKLQHLPLIFSSQYLFLPKLYLKNFQRVKLLPLLFVYVSIKKTYRKAAKKVSKEQMFIFCQLLTTLFYSSHYMNGKVKNTKHKRKRNIKSFPKRHDI